MNEATTEPVLIDGGMSVFGLLTNYSRHAAIGAPGGA